MPVLDEDLMLKRMGRCGQEITQAGVGKGMKMTRLTRGLLIAASFCYWALPLCIAAILSDVATALSTTAIWVGTNNGALSRIQESLQLKPPLSMQILPPIPVNPISQTTWGFLAVICVLGFLFTVLYIGRLPAHAID